VHINGASPHTRRSVVLNRLSFSPGDVLDSRQVRDSERRLKFSQLFKNDAAKGVAPRIVVVPREDDAPSTLANDPTGPRRSAGAAQIRGQSPDDERHVTRRVDIDVYVEEETEPIRRLPPVEPAAPGPATSDPLWKIH
ncbi:MAG: hypothetical protein KDA41_10060, partial [Planctomycetales bacterium]|nr:hypothetical protein [Planctomycetales bacterium]